MQDDIDVNPAAKRNDAPVDSIDPGHDEGTDLLDVVTVLAERWRLLTLAPIAVGALAFGVSFLVTPTFTARTSFLPPQQQQSTAASALASLGALSGLVGGLPGVRSSGDQYVALMQSAHVQDRIIDRFKLMSVYEVDYRFRAREQLNQDVRIALGKKDGLITVETDASDPQLAADMANEYVAELRLLTANLALTEAQQRRAFFETEFKKTQTKLTEAQQVLQRSGFNPGALKAEPKAAAESYATLKASVTSAEVRLQTLRRGLADTTPEVQQQLAQLGALKSELAKAESADTAGGNADYIGRYREFKYQEALFDLFAKQYEMARLDESREGALIQVVDAATPPERKSKPRRLIIAAISGVATFLLLTLGVLIGGAWRKAAAEPARAGQIARLRAALPWR